MSASFAALLLGIGLPLAAQDGQVPAMDRPVMGFVSAAGAVRPVLGIPGAAVMGPAVDLPAGVSSVAISPGGDYALTLVNGTTQLVPLLPRVAPRIIGTGSESDRIYFSPTGSAAAIYSPAAAILRIVGNLPGAPAAVREISLSTLPAPAAAIAIADDGAIVLAAGDGDSGVILFDIEGRMRPVPVPLSVCAMAFQPNAHNAAFAGTDGRLTIVRGVDDTPAYQVLRGSGGAPWAVEFSGDGRMLLAAYRETGTIAVLDTDSGTSTEVACNCQPAGLYRLSAGSVFRLTELSNSGLIVLDAGSPQPRAVFVPPDPPSALDSNGAEQ